MKFCLPARNISYPLTKYHGHLASHEPSLHTWGGGTPACQTRSGPVGNTDKKRMIYTQLSPECLLVKKKKWDQEIRTNYKYKQHQNIRNNIFNQPNNLNPTFNQVFLLLFPSLKCMLGGINNEVDLRIQYSDWSFLIVRRKMLCQPQHTHSRLYVIKFSLFLVLVGHVLEL